MTVFVLHAFCDDQLAETHVFTSRPRANHAAEELLERVAAGVIDGQEVIDANGCRWAVVIEKARVE